MSGFTSTHGEMKNPLMFTFFLFDPALNNMRLSCTIIIIVSWFLSVKLNQMTAEAGIVKMPKEVLPPVVAESPTATDVASHQEISMAAAIESPTLPTSITETQG